MILAKKPIEIFKSVEQFEAYAKDWQHRLFLDNWFINFNLTEDIIYQDGMELWGVSAYSFENSSADITVFNGKLASNCDAKNIAELTLVHELLHLKIEYITDEDIMGQLPPFEVSLTHKALETMAKSLIMAKYNVPYEYFKDNYRIPDSIKLGACRGACK